MNCAMENMKINIHGWEIPHNRHFQFFKVIASAHIT